MLSPTNKYRDIDVDIKKLYKKEIMKNIEIKRQATPKETIKVYKLSEKDEKEVYKLVNRDILRNDGMKRIELGDEFQIGTFVKEKKKTIS